MADAREDESRIWVAIQSYWARGGNELRPVFVSAGERHRGGKGTEPALRPGHWLEDGTPDHEINAARNRAIAND